jgi:hypothetical protein
MKKLITLLLLASALYAGPTLEISGGTLTLHFPYEFNLTDSSAYKTKISSDGLFIFNPLFGVKLIQETNNIYFGASIYGGLNSHAYPMVGVIGSVGFRVFKDKWLHLGLVVGGYTYFTPRSTASFIPVGGVEINAKIPFGKKVFMKVNTLITPLLINESISFGINL